MLWKRIFLLILFLFSIFSLCLAADDFKDLRRQMVENQLKKRGIKNKRVLWAMNEVKRHKFVPLQSIAYAYADHPLRIGNGQTISQPYIVALMTEIIDPKKTDRVLEIGTGSGYQAAVLSLLSGEVYSVEIIPELAKSAATRLNKLEYKNVFVKAGDGFLGWPEAAPFDCIIITCSTPRIPEPLIAQLKEAGRLILPLAEGYPQKLCLFTKDKNKMVKKYITDVLFVPMKGKVEQEKMRD